MNDLPVYETILLTRRGRRLDIALNRTEVLNAFNGAMHVEISEALAFAGEDAGSDVVVLTGAGRAFSAGGDIPRMQHFIAHPEEFDQEVEDAKRLVFTLLDIDKPLIARINGPAVGLGATIALFCDVTFAGVSARIGDPHVAIGLVAGDGGAVIWPQLVGLNRAKEFLMTGEILTAERAAAIGLVNHAVPDADLDTRVDAFCDTLLNGATEAIRGTKITLNIELKRLAHEVLGPGLAHEAASVRSDEHRRRVEAFAARAAEKRKP